MKADRPDRPTESRSHTEWDALLSRTLHGSLRRHQQYRRRFRREATSHRLHAFRIETRRLLAWVALVAGLHEGRVVKTRRLLKRCLRVTATSRDTDVLIALVDQLRSDYPELEKFRRHLCRRRRRAMERSQRRLGRGLDTLSRRLRDLARVTGRATASGVAPLAVVRAFNETQNKVRRLIVAAHRNEANLHRARVALKRLRYMAEALVGVVPGAWRSWVVSLRRTQHAMGDIHDLDVFSRRLAEFTECRVRQRRRLRKLSLELARRRRLLWRRFAAKALPLNPIGSRWAQRSILRSLSS